MRKVKEYARSKKLDKEAPSGKLGVALGNVESTEEEQRGDLYDGELEDINAANGAEGSKGKRLGQREG